MGVQPHSTCLLLPNELDGAGGGNKWLDVCFGAACTPSIRGCIDGVTAALTQQSRACLGSDPGMEDLPVLNYSA